MNSNHVHKKSINNKQHHIRKKNSKVKAVKTMRQFIVLKLFTLFMKGIVKKLRILTKD